MAGGPCPLKIESADATVDVEDLPAEIKPRASPGFHGRGADFGERHAPRRHFGLPVAGDARDLERAMLEKSRDAERLARRQPRHAAGGVHAAFFEDPLGQPAWKAALEETGQMLFGRLLAEAAER